MLRMLPVGAYQANCYILGCNKAHEGLVIDPGDEVLRIVQEISTLGLNIKYIFITHGHFDHTGGARQLRKITGAPVWIHSLDEPALGFHVAGLFDKVLDITECHLQPEPSNAIRNFIREYTLQHGYPYFHIREQHGLMRNLLIRTTTTGEVMVVVSFYEDDREKIEALLQAVQERFPEITSLQWVVNPKGNDTLEGLTVQLYHGRDHIVEELDGLKFKVSAKSFFQTNTRQAARLYRTVLEFAGIGPEDNVYDLYSGTGTIGLFLAQHAGRVTCIESVAEAVQDAEENARLNDTENITFLQGEVKELFNEELFKIYGRPDVVILDPPRSGIHPDTVKMLLEVLPEKIVYVSCNPATQARDIQGLLSAYQPLRIRPVDMFPHTDHVENVAALGRMKEL